MYDRFQYQNATMITIVDYQMGNLRSVQKGIERVGGQAKISSDPKEIASSEKLILPGVGAFGDAMTEIHRRDLKMPIIDFINSNRPFLGICLGLQLLFENGFENGEHQGLGVLAGDVVRFNLPPSYKVPHMGWNTVTKCADAPILCDTPDNSHFYFVHSYALPESEFTLATARHADNFSAVIGRDNFVAAQFHPERSSADGARLLRNFLEPTP